MKVRGIPRTCGLLAGRRCSLSKLTLTTSASPGSVSPQVGSRELGMPPVIAKGPQSAGRAPAARLGQVAASLGLRKRFPVCPQSCQL